MQYIPTTQPALSKMKKAAKLAVRDRAIQHADALDEVAKQSGYSNWKHVTDSAQITVASKASLGMPNSMYWPEPIQIRVKASEKPAFLFVLGRTGSGKTLHAIDYALSHLRDGKRVKVIDTLRSYMTLAKKLSGTILSIDPDGHVEVTQGGDTPLEVYDLFALRQGITHQMLPVMPGRNGTDASQTLLVIDELWRVSQILPNLTVLVEDHLRNGGSVLICSDENDSNTLAPFVGISSKVSVRRTFVRLSKG